MNILQAILEGAKLALGAMSGKPSRTLLTMLGVATGIFLTTCTLTLVNSMKGSVSANLSSLGNTTLFVSNWPFRDTRDDWFKFFNRPKPSYRDFQSLKNELNPQLITGICYQASITGQVIKGNGRSVSKVSIIAATADYGRIYDLAVGEGRYFSDIEADRGNPVCLIGYNVAEGLFPGASAVGETIRLGGKKVKVTGVLERKGAGVFGMESPDDQVFVPYLFSSKAFDLDKREINKMITLKALEYKKLEELESEIIGILRASRGLKIDVEDNFSVNKQEAIMKQLDGIFGFLEKGGLTIVTFSLVIGLFSVAMIMYIAVRERTNEIGIQKSLGATNSFILYQFLIESILICFVGGIIGLALLYVATLIGQQVIQSTGSALSIQVSKDDLLFALKISLGTGVLAGMIPAALAARVDPVVAIRMK